MSRVAVVQMNSTDSVSDNLAVVRALCEDAKAHEVQLLVLPENFAYMGKDGHAKLQIAEKEGEGIIQDTLIDLSKQHNLWIIAGTIPLVAPDNKVFASSLVYDSQGHQVARYDKIHLFDVEVSSDETHNESNTIVAGENATLVDTPIGCMGLSVCYDVRFPELYRTLQKNGAELFTVVSAFTKVTGACHWHTLLKARAIENMCYVLAPNQSGVHPSGRETYGHSIIINPWGEVLAEAKEGEHLIYADIDLEALYEKRASFPCLSHQVL